MQALKGGETPPWRLDPCTVDHEVFTFGLARERLWKELNKKKNYKKNAINIHRIKKVTTTTKKDR